MKRVSAILQMITTVFFLMVLYCSFYFMDAVQYVKNWSKKQVDQTTLRLVLVYLLGFIVLGTGWWIGFLGPVVASAGWISKVVGGLVLAHIGLAFYTAHTKNKGLVNWLDKIDTSILSIGFLGKLFSIATVLSAVSGTDAASIATGLKAVSNGVSVALFSTMLGLGLSIWTHCGTLVVSNRLNHDT